MPWETTVDAWIRSLPVSQSFKNDVVYPWITALIGSRRADALRASARSILQTFALAFPANVAQGATTFNSTIGLQGNLQRMLDRSPTARVHLGTPVHGAEARARRLVPARRRPGTSGPYRFVVLNAPPHAGRELLRALPGFAAPHGAAGRVRVLRLAHPDSHRPGLRATRSPQLGGLQRRGPTVANARAASGTARCTTKLPSGATIDVFKSWAAAPTRRPEAHPAGAAVQAPADQPLDDPGCPRLASAAGTRRPVLQRPVHHRL